MGRGAAANVFGEVLQLAEAGGQRSRAGTSMEKVFAARGGWCFLCWVKV